MDKQRETNGGHLKTLRHLQLTSGSCRFWQHLRPDGNVVWATAPSACCGQAGDAWLTGGRADRKWTHTLEDDK